MAYIFETIPKNYTPSDPAWIAKVDAAELHLAERLETVGWTKTPRYPYGVVRTIADMVSFLTDPEALFYSVFPVGWTPDGAHGTAQIIADALPGGYTPPVGFAVFMVTGSTLKAVIHAAVIAALQFLDGNLIAIGSVPGETEPNTILMENQGAVIITDNPTPEPSGLALSTSFTRLARGGWVCQSPANGDPANYISIFFTRGDVAGIDPFKPQIAIAKAFSAQPVQYNMTTNVDRTDFIEYLVTQADDVLAAGPAGCFMAQISDGHNGQVNVAALNLPVASAGITEATFGMVSPDSGAGTVGFRTGPAVQGFVFMDLMGALHIEENPGVRGPLVQTLYGGGDWESNLGQITEAWVGFSVATDPIAPLLGIIDGALVINKSFTAESTPAFQFDGLSWKVFTNLPSVTGAGQIGTIAFRTPEDAVAPTCP